MTNISYLYFALIVLFFLTMCLIIQQTETYTFVGKNTSYLNHHERIDVQDEINLAPFLHSTLVLVNPNYHLEKEYKPVDLVTTNVPFVSYYNSEGRLMRKEAAKALEELFSKAREDGIYLGAISGYRSYETQKSLFDHYVERDGYRIARTYSALPGTSEHQTGLSMDVSSISGYCAATACFEDTEEANWLEENSADFGFIVRYPKGKEDITGYRYEPWHLRFVGSLATYLKENDLTLEEYYNLQ